MFVWICRQDQMWLCPKMVDFPGAIFFSGFWNGQKGGCGYLVFRPKSVGHTIWLSNIAMENGPFIDDLPIKKWWFSMAMLNNQRVCVMFHPQHPTLADTSGWNLTGRLWFQASYGSSYGFLDFAREMNEPKQAKFSQCPGESLKLKVNSMYSTSTVRLHISQTQNLFGLKVSSICIWP